MFQDSRFDSFLDRVWKLHSFVGKQFDAVVLIRIVRGGDDDADMEIILADEASDAGSGKNASEGNGSAALNEASSDDGRYVGTRLAGIRANERVGRGMIAVQIFGDGKADGKESGVVERGSSGNAADTICSKKLSRHRVNGRQAPTAKKFSTAAGREPRRATASVLTCSERGVAGSERNTNDKQRARICAAAEFDVQPARDCGRNSAAFCVLRARSGDYASAVYFTGVLS